MGVKRMNIYQMMNRLESMHTNEIVKSMTKLDNNRIYFWGSREYHYRVVFEDSDGKFWCRWYGQLIQVTNLFENKYATSGWRTVESY